MIAKNKSRKSRAAVPGSHLTVRQTRLVTRSPANWSAKEKYEIPAKMAPDRTHRTQGPWLCCHTLTSHKGSFSSTPPNALFYNALLEGTVL